MRYPYGPKGTWGRQAEKICSGESEIPQDELPDLLEWLQDGNWPGAIEIAEFLAARPLTVLPRIREILRHDDNIWKYWLIELLALRFTRETCQHIASELWKLATEFDDDEVHLKALEICARHRLTDTALLRNTLLQKLAADPSNSTFYRRLLRRVEQKQ